MAGRADNNQVLFRVWSFLTNWDDMMEIGDVLMMWTKAAAMHCLDEEFVYNFLRNFLSLLWHLAALEIKKITL